MWGQQRERAARRAAARGASDRGLPPPPFNARTKYAPPAYSPYLAQRDPRKSLARPLRRSLISRLWHTSMLLSSSSLFYSVCLSSCERMLSVCIGVSHFFLFSVQHARVFYGIRNAPSRLQNTTFTAMTSLITVLCEQISSLKAWIISLSTRERTL